MAIPEDIRRLLEDAEYFVAEVLHGEKLSKTAKERREALLQGFLQVKYRYQQEFQVKGATGDWGSKLEDSSDDNLSGTHPSDNVSVASENQEEAPFADIPLIAAQDLSSVLKQGYLEKKRRDHSFFGSEWRKRFCLLNTNIFYYYSSEKDKQQRDAFYIYDAYLVQNLRKDSKKNCCFEVISMDKKVYQFTAQSTWEAKEWVDHIQFVLKDINSNVIPIEEDEEEEEVDRMGEAVDEETYDDVDTPSLDHKHVLPHLQASTKEIPEDEIYEELPEDDFPPPIDWDQDEEDNISQGISSIGYEDCYLGLWDCTGEEEDELSFKRGDMIHILSKDYNSFGWWVGELNGTIGIVPKDYLMAAFDI